MANINRWVHSALTTGGAAMHTVQRRFNEILGPGRENWNEEEHIKQVRPMASVLLSKTLTFFPFQQRTIINNMYELTQSSKYWNSPEMNSQNMLGVWFAASHQPWSVLTSLLLELAAREDLQAEMREEIENHAQLDDFKSLDKLPLLDSFMKEVVRLYPVDRGTMRRCHFLRAGSLISK